MGRLVANFKQVIGGKFFKECPLHCYRAADAYWIGIKDNKWGGYANVRSFNAYTPGEPDLTSGSCVKAGIQDHMWNSTPCTGSGNKQFVLCQQLVRKCLLYCKFFIENALDCDHYNE